MTKITQEKIKRFMPEIFITIFVIATSFLMLWRIHMLDLMQAITDQIGHLVFSRLFIDSMTPGLSQIGYWPPLLHILMIPFISISFLYESALAGFIVLVPFLILGSILLYKLSYLLTKNKIISVASSILFIANPNILYYSVTPMMEVLYISNLIAVAYFLTLWLKKNKFSHLIICGIFITLASVSRFEGLILIPIVSLIVLIKLIKLKYSYSKIESTIILFGIIEVAGLIFILIYGWIYGNNPLVFITGGWWRQTDLITSLATKFNLLISIKYLIHASYYMLGKPLVIISLACFPLMLILSKNRLRDISIAIILFSPFIFTIYSLYKGSIYIVLPEFAQNHVFINERYGLNWIGFAIIIPFMFFYYMQKRISLRLIANIFRYIINPAFIIFIITFAFYQLYDVSFIKNFDFIQNNINRPTLEQEEVASYLKKNYDFGKIFNIRADNLGLLIESGIPLKNYLYEGNYLYYDQAIKEPWFFARWVIMFNSTKGKEYKWASEREPIFKNWGNSELFDKYYELVLINDYKRLYKIREDSRAKFEEAGFDSSEIPSINSSIQNWDPQTVRNKIIKK